MCETNPCCCQKPEELKDNPKECSKEQIEKCHGTTGEHPCVKKEPGCCDER